MFHIIMNPCMFIYFQKYIMPMGGMYQHMEVYHKHKTVYHSLQMKSFWLLAYKIWWFKVQLLQLNYNVSNHHFRHGQMQTCQIHRDHISFDVDLSTTLLYSVIGDISFASCLQLYLWVYFLCTDFHFAVCFFSGDHLWLKFEYTLTCIW